MLNILFIVSSFLTAQAPPVLEQVQGPARARLLGIHVGPEGLTIGLAEQARLVVTLQGAAPLEVDWPQPLSLASRKHWHVAPTAPEVPAAGSWQRVFSLEPLHPGLAELTLEPLRFRTGNGPWQTLTWKPWQIQVTTQVPRADRTLLRDITPPEEPPVPTPPSWEWLWIVVAGLLVCWLAVYGWRRRRWPVALPAPPEQLALAELEHLTALPIGEESLRSHFSQLNDLLRRYLEQRFAVPARQQTTAELLHTFRQFPGWTEEQQELLRDLLTRCDQARFSSAPLKQADWQMALSKARHFFTQTGTTSTVLLTDSHSGKSGEFSDIG